MITVQIFVKANVERNLFLLIINSVDEGVSRVNQMQMSLGIVSLTASSNVQWR